MKAPALAENVWEKRDAAANLGERSAHESVGERATVESAPVEEEQLRTLVQQLFFRPEFPPIRHVALAAPDMQTDLARLSLNIATVLAEDENRTVGVIDTDSSSLASSVGLRNLPGRRDARGTEITDRLWAVPLEGWRHETDTTVASDQNLYRLRQVTAEFDFSLLTCPPVPWLTARVAQTCDGVVIVVTANKTRRLVAVQMRDHLRSAGIPVLGSVLAGRRFPVPLGLYRKL